MENSCSVFTKSFIFLLIIFLFIQLHIAKRTIAMFLENLFFGTLFRKICVRFNCGSRKTWWNYTFAQLYGKKS